MISSHFPFFHHSENSVHAKLAGCEIPVVFKPQEGPVHLCGKGELESLYRPASDRKGGEGKEEKRKATSNQSPFKETNHAKPNH